MSTRAVYTFIDADSKYNGKTHKGDVYSVYKHHDGYPSGACQWIKAAQGYAWEFPRFEAADFAAAFVRGNKEEGGGSVYFTKGYKAHGDLEYRYEIVGTGGKEPIVRAYSVSGDGPGTLIWTDTFSSLLDLSAVEA